MKKKFWEFVNREAESAELLLYGDISQSSWYGDEVTPRQFADELKELGEVKNITVSINSGGGDVFAAQTIGNMLEKHEATVTARIEGLCASAATIVACHCDRVTAVRDSTYMVHPVKMGAFGYYDSAEFEKYIEAMDVIRENIVSLYAEKTGLAKEDAAALMDNTTWMTAEEAMEKGFVDEVISGKTLIENRGGLLFVNSVATSLSYAQIPDLVKNSGGTSPAENKKETEKMDIKTIDDLRSAYSELVDALEKAAAENAANAERARIRDIEEMALPGSEKMTFEAKFEKPVDAAEYAKNAIKNAKEQGAVWQNNAMKDMKDSGMGDVGDPDHQGKTDSFMDAIKNCKCF